MVRARGVDIWGVYEGWKGKADKGSAGCIRKGVLQGERS